MKSLLLFIDGLGVGVRDAEVNPLAACGGEILSLFHGDKTAKPLPFGGFGFSLDAHLGVPGLPQSATGQTTILSGVNAPLMEGRHVVGFPTEKLREVLSRTNILKGAKELGLRSTFLNAYRPGIDEMVRRKKYRFLSATTVATIGAGLPFRRIEDLQKGKAVYQEFTNVSLTDQGYDVPVFTPEKAGSIVATLAHDHDFSLFEYFQTDRVGHLGKMSGAVEQIERLESFLHAVLEGVEEGVERDSITVLLVSDHGNIEDISTRKHTHNRVFAAAWGERAFELAVKLGSLLDVRPAVQACLEGREVPEPIEIQSVTIPTESDRASEIIP